MKPNFNFQTSSSSTNIRNSLTKGSDNELKKKSDNFFQFKSAFKRKTSEQKKKELHFLLYLI